MSEMWVVFDEKGHKKAEGVSYENAWWDAYSKDREHFFPCSSHYAMAKQLTAGWTCKRVYTKESLRTTVGGFVDIEPEFSRVINEKFWELLA